MENLDKTYEDGVSDEKARIIEIVLGFRVADKESPEPGNALIQFPLEDLVAAINGE